MSERDLSEMRRLLTEATASLSQDYFLLPVADTQGGEPLVQYRERVYAYELYHQLRLRWPDWPYSLAGEVDKRGHPVVRGGYLDNAKPDLIVHVPGEMRHNLLVLEIKASRPDLNPAEPAAVEQDLRKLIAFRTLHTAELGDTPYGGAIFLVFGEHIDRVRQLAQRNPEVREQLGLIELFHHLRPGEPARALLW